MSAGEPFGAWCSVVKLGGQAPAGKMSNADCFRSGTVGRIFESDVRDLLVAIRVTLAEMSIDLKDRV